MPPTFLYFPLIVGWRFGPIYIIIITRIIYLLTSTVPVLSILVTLLLLFAWVSILGGEIGLPFQLC